MTQVEVMDGVEAVARVAANRAGSLDVLIIDAGSDDASLAMTCPPPAFLEASFMQHARSALAPTSLLIINCVTRSAAAFSQALNAVKVMRDAVMACALCAEVQAGLTWLPTTLRTEVIENLMSGMFTISGKHSTCIKSCLYSEHGQRNIRMLQRIQCSTQICPIATLQGAYS